MNTEYEEIENLIDEEADIYESTEEILSRYGLTFEQAIEKANEFRKKFFDTLKVKDIYTSNISKICYDVFKLLDSDTSDDMIFIYTALLTENGLLFWEISDDEQKVQLWLEQSERIQLLTNLIKKEPEYKARLSALKNFKQKKDTTADIDDKEQAILYQMVIENTFIYKKPHGNIFLHNIGEMVRLVNGNEEYRKIKPYIYFAVLTRKHKYITTHKDYSPNFSPVFKYQKYNINRDTGKNFNTYQSYLELYGQLRDSYADEIDVEFTDYCMANLSNLTVWFYDNCEPTDDIPMSLVQTVDYLSTAIWITPELDDISDFIDENPILDIAYGNELENFKQWSNFVNAVQNGEDISEYVEQLYKKANAYAHCKDHKKALILAELYLYSYMEEYNRKLLVSAVEKLQYKTVTEK